MSLKNLLPFLLNYDLLNGNKVAVDGTKIRAVNAKKNNFNFEKVNRHLDYIDNKTEEYFKLLDTLACSIYRQLADGKTAHWSLTHK